MAVRPVDIQISVQRTAEAPRANQQDGARPEMAQQVFAEQLEKQARHQSQFVQESNKPEQQSVNKDGRGPGGEGGSQGGKERKKEKETMAPAQSDSMFDISI